MCVVTGLVLILWTPPLRCTEKSRSMLFPRSPAVRVNTLKASQRGGKFPLIQVQSKISPQPGPTTSPLRGNEYKYKAPSKPHPKTQAPKQETDDEDIAGNWALVLSVCAVILVTVVLAKMHSDRAPVRTPVRVEPRPPVKRTRAATAPIESRATNRASPKKEFVVVGPAPTRGKVASPKVDVPAIITVPRAPAFQRVLKGNHEKFREFLETHNIRTLYHFTDKRNLQSIRDHGGLYSWYTLEQRQIPIPMSAANDFSRARDKGRGLEDFVRLSFNCKQPMMYVAMQKRGLDPIILEVSPDVALWEGTRFSDVNATATGVTVGEAIDDLHRVRLDHALTGAWQNSQEKAWVQAEVLVKTTIPIEYIKGL
jgi:hypothetical protein